MFSIYFDLENNFKFFELLGVRLYYNLDCLG